MNSRPNTWLKLSCASRESWSRCATNSSQSFALRLPRLNPFRLFSNARSMRFGLSDVNFDHGVEWEVKLPEGQLLRDYLMGNLYLYVESSWNASTKEGRIEVRPSDLLFFDSDRRVIGNPTKALAMRYALWRQGIRLRRESLIINFREAD